MNNLNIYGNLNAVLISRSNESKLSQNDAINFYDLNAEAPEDWAGRFYWEIFFEAKQNLLN